MSKGNKSYFERIEGKKWMKNENQAKRGKNKIKNRKKGKEEGKMG